MPSEFDITVLLYIGVEGSLLAGRAVLEMPYEEKGAWVYLTVSVLVYGALPC